MPLRLPQPNDFSRNIDCHTVYRGRHGAADPCDSPSPQVPALKVVEEVEMGADVESAVDSPRRPDYRRTSFGGPEEVKLTPFYHDASKPRSVALPVRRYQQIWKALTAAQIDLSLKP